MPVNSAQTCIDHALRQNGAPVINIEVDDDQLTDCLDLAIQFYQENHFDGIFRDYVKYQVTGTVVNVADSTGFAVNDVVTTSQGGSARILDVTGNVITTSESRSGVMFAATQTLTNGVASSVISSVVLGTVDTGYITLPDSVFSVLRVVNTTGILNGPDMLFNVQYQIMANEIRNIAAGESNYMYTTMQHLSHLDYILRMEKIFRFNRRINRLYFDASWNLNPGNWVVLEVYMQLDPEVYTEVYNDRWLKKYLTALVKKQWGTNISKYDDVVLPGGVTMQGKYILEQAMQEIKDLEEEALGAGAPLSFLIG